MSTRLDRTEFSILSSCCLACFFFSPYLHNTETQNSSLCIHERHQITLIFSCTQHEPTQLDWSPYRDAISPILPQVFLSLFVFVFFLLFVFLSSLLLRYQHLLAFCSGGLMGEVLPCCQSLNSPSHQTALLIPWLHRPECMCACAHAYVCVFLGVSCINQTDKGQFISHLSPGLSPSLTLTDTHTHTCASPPSLTLRCPLSQGLCICGSGQKHQDPEMSCVPL